MNFSQNCLQNCVVDKPAQGNYVYLNKIFYNQEQNASPILTALTTNATDFTQQLSVGAAPPVTNPVSVPAQVKPSNCSCGCGCGSGAASSIASPQASYNCNFMSPCNCCCDLTVTADTNFVINNTYVVVRSFQLTTPADLTAADVTVDGMAITDLAANGNQYIGDISGIMPDITKCACHSPCSNVCPGNFVIVTAAGPWSMVATIVVEGTVYSGGTSCQFKLCVNTAEATPLDITGAASFAFCGVEIPCQALGYSPNLVFSFDACANLLNPAITVTCTDDVCTPILTGSLVVTPIASLQVTRASLFNLGSYEVTIPCDDLGQCDPCNPVEAPCVNDIACQCCDTNGYRF